MPAFVSRNPISNNDDRGKLLAIAHRARQRVLDEQEIVAGGLHQLADRQKDELLRREIHEQAAAFEGVAVDPYIWLAEYLEKLAGEAKVR